MNLYDFAIERWWAVAISVVVVAYLIKFAVDRYRRG
jgi:hypothetical protein